MKYLSIFLCILCLSGCVSTQKQLTPEQRLYSLHAEYNIWLDKVTDVAEVVLSSPEASQEVKLKVREIISDIATKNQQIITLLRTVYQTKEDVESISVLLKQRILEFSGVFDDLKGYKQ